MNTLDLDVKEPQTPPPLQPFRDLAGPQAPSDWLRQVAHKRVFSYDRIRQFMTRLTLLAVLAGLFTTLPTVATWAWLVLLIGLTQGVLEILLEPSVRRETLKNEPLVNDGNPLAPLVGIWKATYGVIPVNTTGVLGFIATILNVFAVCFGTHADADTAWVKVAALAVTILFANSATSGPFVEATTYADSVGGRVMRVMRPWMWPVMGALAAGVVARSAAVGRWPEGSLPYAYMVCLLVYALGLRLREYDRACGAAGTLIKRATAVAGDRIGTELHKMTSPLTKGPLDRILAVDGIEPSDRAELQLFAESVGMLHQQSRRLVSFDQLLLPSIDVVIARICLATGADPVMRIDLPLPAEGEQPRPDRMSEESFWFARHVLLELAQNACNAYHAGSYVDRPLEVTASLREGHVVVAVADAMPLLPRGRWSEITQQGTLAHFHSRIRARGGTLRQDEHVLGKVVEARWPNRLRPLLEKDYSDV